MTAAAPCAAPHPTPRAPGFSAPRRACDCHVHVFGSQRDFPLVKQRLYTPPPTPFSDYHRLRGVLGLDRAVIVQPSVYGTDNRATLEAAAAGGEDFRAVVVVDADTPIAALQTMHHAGARGVRVNPMFSGAADVSDLGRLARTLADLNWHLQVLVDVSQLEGLGRLVETLPVPLVFDHMGHVPAAKGVDDPGFQTLLRLLGEGRCWVKLSGAYRVTAHTHPPYDGDLIDLLDRWVPDAATRDRILVDNPARLYDFEPSA